MTVVLIGASTWSRRFIDWEIAATLADGSDQRRALIGIALPSVADARTRLPARLAVNLSGSHWPGYAVMSDYPKTTTQLDEMIRTALYRRDRYRPLASSLGRLMRRDHPNLETSN